MYAIIETGGKQYKVKQGDVIRVEKLGAAAGTKYTFSNVLLMGEGEGVTVGSPYIEGASVDAEVIAEGKEKKVVVYKYKAKKGYHKKKGHRQPYTGVKIIALNT
jgi:large subunit ribosomal protein L21